MVQRRTIGRLCQLEEMRTKTLRDMGFVTPGQPGEFILVNEKFRVRQVFAAWRKWAHLEMLAELEREHARALREYKTKLCLAQLLCQEQRP